MVFQEIEHNKNLDEIFHQYRIDNIANSYLWIHILEMVIKKANFFDSIVECGVGRGRSIITLASLMEIYTSLKKRNQFQSYEAIADDYMIYGLDSFEGFPEPTKKDISARNPIKGEWSESPSGKYQYTPEFLTNVLKNASVDLTKVKLIKGFFDKTTPELAKNKLSIGVLHCDGDLYESIKYPLNFLADKVVIGGVIVFDDFLLKSSPKDDYFPGARLAFNEFFEENKNYFSLFENPKGSPILVRESYKNK